MAEKFSLKDHLFNTETVRQLAEEYAAALPGFDPDRFERDALGGFAERELMARLEWIADCMQAQLAQDFLTMADQLEAAMPEPLDPTLRDDDFGQFIHAVPGILAARHGLDHHPRAMALLHAATQRFSMEFYIRPFLNHNPDETLADLALWAEDGNYHVRRLVSEGTRPRLPWAKAVNLSPAQTLPLLDRLAGDPTRYVTRSVANHLNDLSKTVPDLVLDRLRVWGAGGRQADKEHGWLTRHALRTLVKAGHPGALAALGYRANAPVQVALQIRSPKVKPGAALSFACHVTAAREVPVLIDYRIGFARPGGRSAEKVFKLKQAVVTASAPLRIEKSHKLKRNASTFTLHPGIHSLTLQVNGVDRATEEFELL